jgi:hypothetical protein
MQLYRDALYSSRGLTLNPGSPAIQVEPGLPYVNVEVCLADRTSRGFFIDLFANQKNAVDMVNECSSHALIRRRPASIHVLPKSATVKYEFEYVASHLRREMQQ